MPKLTLDLISSTLEEKRKRCKSLSEDDKEIKTELDVLEIEFNKIKEKYDMLKKKIDEKKKKRNLIKTLHESLKTDIHVYELQQQIIVQELEQKQILQDQELVQKQKLVQKQILQEELAQKQELVPEKTAQETEQKQEQKLNGFVSKKRKLSHNLVSLTVPHSPSVTPPVSYSAAYPGSPPGSPPGSHPESHPGYPPGSLYVTPNVSPRVSPVASVSSVLNESLVFTVSNSPTNIGVFKKEVCDAIKALGKMNRSPINNDEIYGFFKTTHDRIFVIGNKHENKWTTNVDDINNSHRISWSNNTNNIPSKFKDSLKKTINDFKTLNIINHQLIVILVSDSTRYENSYDIMLYTCN